MAKEYVPIFYDWVEVTAELTAQEKGRLIDAIVLYASGGNWQEQIKGNERYLFPAFRKQIDRANEISSVRAMAGANGVKQREANKSKPKQTEANESKPPNNNNNENKEEKENDKVGITARARFTPPTAEEVAAYCRERGNRVNPRKFVDFYTSKGWRVGKEPMKDWRACVRTWEQEDAGGSARRKTVSAQDYTQRTYTEEELLGVSDDLIEEARNLRDGQQLALV